MVSFDIFGSCVSRDIFRYDLDKRFTISNFISFISPLSLEMSGSQIVDPVLEGMSPWHNRNYMHDLRKDVFECLEKSESDFFLFDMADLRYPLVKYDCADGQLYITKSRTQNYYENYIKTLDIREIETINPLTMDWNQVKKLLVLFSKNIHHRYSKNRTILIIPHMADSYKEVDVNGDEKISKFDGVSSTNDFIKKCSEFVQSLLSCHCIRVPKSVIADKNHIWGLDRLHYTDDTYRHLLDEIQKISTSEFDDTDENMNFLQRNKYEWQAFVHGGKISNRFLNTVDSFSKYFNISHITFQSSLLADPSIGMEFNIDCIDKYARSVLDEDINKKTFDFVETSGAQYFILDAFDTRIPLHFMKSRSGDKIFEITRSDYLNSIREELLKKYTITDTVNPIDLSIENTIDRIKRYCNRLLSLIDSENIILIKSQYPSHYSEENGIKPFKKYDKINCYFEVIYAILIKELEPGYVVEGKYTSKSFDEPNVMDIGSSTRILNELDIIFKEIHRKNTTDISKEDAP